MVHRRQKYNQRQKRNRSEIFFASKRKKVSFALFRFKAKQKKGKRNGNETVKEANEKRLKKRKELSETKKNQKN